jgi:hypothetical protein
MHTHTHTHIHHAKPDHFQQRFGRTCFVRTSVQAMQFSNLFAERFVDQVQVVAYLHQWTPTAEKRGEFVFWNGGNSSGVQESPAPLAGSAVDGTKTVHAARVCVVRREENHADGAVHECPCKAVPLQPVCVDWLQNNDLSSNITQLHVRFRPSAPPVVLLPRCFRQALTSQHRSTAVHLRGTPQVHARRGGTKDEQRP